MNNRDVSVRLAKNVYQSFETIQAKILTIETSIAIKSYIVPIDFPYVIGLHIFEKRALRMEFLNFLNFFKFLYKSNRVTCSHEN